MKDLIANAFESPSPIIAAIISLVVSGIIGWIFSRQSYKRQVMPVVVFTHEGPNKWQMVNVGNGPAMSITVLHGDGKKNWHDPTDYYPLAKDGKVTLISPTKMEWLAV